MDLLGGEFAIVPGMPPLTRSEALALGISDAELRGPHYRRLFRGVHVPVDEPLDLDTWVAAARKALPTDARLTGMSALTLRGIRFGVGLPLHFQTARSLRREISGVRLSRVAQLPEPGGVATIPEAFAVAARDLDLVPAVQLGDAIIHQRPRWARSVIEAAPRSVAEWIRAGSESVQETKVRLMLVLAGLPEPQTQVEVRDRHGRFVARLDLYFPEFKVAVEYDGEHHAPAEQRHADVERREALAALGITCIVVNRPRLWPPEKLVLQVWQVLRERGHAGPRPWFDLRWRTAFGSMPR